MANLVNKIKALMGGSENIESKTIQSLKEPKLEDSIYKNWFKEPKKPRNLINDNKTSYLCYVGSLGTVPKVNLLKRPVSRTIRVKKLKQVVIDNEPKAKIEKRVTRTRTNTPKIRKVIDISSGSESEYENNISSDESIIISTDEEDYQPVKSSYKKKYKVRDTEFKSKINENDSESRTKFIYIKESKPKRSFTTKDQAISNTNKKNFVLRSDAFESPKKQKEGVLLLSKTPSPSKKGIISLIRTTPSSSGRNGSPRKRKIELQDQSARKRANKTLYSKLLDDGISDDDEDYNENFKIAERIILESKSMSTPSSTPKKLNNFNLPIFNPDFKPTPLPTTTEEEFFEGKYNDIALFLDGPEGYFEQHGATLKPTFNSMTQAPDLNYDEFNSFVLFSGFLHSNQKKDLINKYKQLYHQYLFELKEGFNLIFYGTGSKRNLLLNFVEEYLLDFINVPVLVVNGYNPSVKFNEVLMEIFKILKLNKKIPKRTNECIDYLVNHYKNLLIESKLIILFHNIDGESFRDEKIQDYISRISSIKQFHLIASIDHINSPLLWDSLRLSNFNFVWHNVPTYEDYTTEISFKDPLMLGQSTKSSTSNGAKYVLSSLTSSSKKLYKILAENQLKNMKEQIIAKQLASINNSLKGHIKFGIEFTILYRLCVEQFITSNEVNFRTMLMEFVEHKMAILTRDRSGTEIVYVPYTYDELLQLIENELQ